MKRWMVWGGIVAVLLGVGQFFLPVIASNGIAKGIKTFADAREVEVTAQKFPAVLMLGGSFDKITVDAKGVQTDKIVFDEFMVNLEDVQVDVSGIFGQGDFLLKNVKHAEIKAVISQDELASLINRKIKGAKNAQVSITPQKVTVKSMISLGNNLINASAELEGKIIASDNRIVFTTEHFNIDNSTFGKFGGAVFTDLVLVDFKQLPFAVKVKKVVMEEQRALIEADNRE